MGTHHNVVHKYTASTGRAEGQPLDSNFRALAASIVIQAVEDWAGLILAEHRKSLKPPTCGRGKYERKVKVPNSYDDIREFLRSDYCALLCDVINIDPEVILERLEKWLTAYRKRGVLPPPMPGYMGVK